MSFILLKHKYIQKREWLSKSVCILITIDVNSNNWWVYNIHTLLQYQWLFSSCYDLVIFRKIERRKRFWLTASKIQIPCNSLFQLCDFGQIIYSVTQNPTCKKAVFIMHFHTKQICCIKLRQPFLPRLREGASCASSYFHPSRGKVLPPKPVWDIILLELPLIFIPTGHSSGILFLMCLPPAQVHIHWGAAAGKHRVTLHHCRITQINTEISSLGSVSQHTVQFDKYLMD